MPTLKNPRQELFAQEIVKGKSMTQAYIDAGYLAEGHSAEVCASRMLSKVEIAARIRELQERAAVRVELSRQDIIQMLINDRLDAKAAGQHSVAVQAVKLLGSELQHMFTDRQEVKHTDISALGIDELRAYVEAMELSREQLVELFPKLATLAPADATPAPTAPGSDAAN